MYNHQNQFRCTIIRGKSKTELDNLLPTYALVIDEICPCAREVFERKFNEEFATIVHGKNADTAAMKKTLDNHRTEIAGKLFGMYYLADDGIVYASERTKKYIADSDQPAFFKDICFKLQFPNGMNKITTLEPLLQERISFRQYPFILKLIKLAKNDGRKVSINAIGYYVLNALDVLKGEASVEEVYNQIKDDLDHGIERKIAIPEGKASSFTMQHIREQLNYLELANLIFIDDERNVILNSKEEKCIDYFISKCGEKPMFDVYAYPLSEVKDRETFYYAWDAYYGKISPNAELFETKVEALFVKEESAESPERGEQGGNTVELGDEGEMYVLNKEKARVAAFNPRLVNKVLPLGKTKGLGYDIQSVIAEKGDMAEFVKYIEVKSTKRVTAPDLRDASWLDTINITRNEWVAAVQHKEFYSIYRVYFVRDGIVAYIINNVYKKESDGLLQITPMMYRVDFRNSAIDAVLE